MATPHECLQAGLAWCHETAEHSDCTIVCGAYHFKVHKVILGIHSDYFKTAFKADTFKEGRTSTIELKSIERDVAAFEDACDDPDMVKLMIDYFYHLDYLQNINDDAIKHPESSENNTPKTTTPQEEPTSSSATPGLPASSSPATNVHLIKHAKVFSIAVKYRARGLQRFAAEHFELEALEHWKHPDFAHAVQIIYNTTPEEITELRRIATKILIEHSDDLLCKIEIMTLLRSVPGLACDLLTHDRRQSTDSEMAVITGTEHSIPCKDIEARGDFVRAQTYVCNVCSAKLEACARCLPSKYYWCPKCNNRQ